MAKRKQGKKSPPSGGVLVAAVTAPPPDAPPEVDVTIRLPLAAVQKLKHLAARTGKNGKEMTGPELAAHLLVIEIDKDFKALNQSDRIITRIHGGSGLTH